MISIKSESTFQGCLHHTLIVPYYSRNLICLFLNMLIHKITPRTNKFVSNYLAEVAIVGSFVMRKASARLAFYQ